MNDVTIKPWLWLDNDYHIWIVIKWKNCTMHTMQRISLGKLKIQNQQFVEVSRNSWNISNMHRGEFATIYDSCGLSTYCNRFFIRFLSLHLSRTSFSTFHINDCWWQQNVFCVEISFYFTYFNSINLKYYKCSLYLTFKFP